VHGAAAGHGEIDLQIAQAVCVELEGLSENAIASACLPGVIVRGAAR